MNIFSSFISQFVQLFGSQPGTRKLMLLVVMGGSMAGLGWLMVHATTGGYVPVLTQANMSETGAAMGKLSQMRIPCKTENNGATLLVASNRQDEAVMLLAMDGIYDRGAVGNELLDRNSFGDSKFKQEKNYLRVREGEMARTLMSLTEVENARVHLALPDDQLFVKDQRPPKASVVVKLRTGSRLTDRQINGIVNLVSHSVEGLQPENVTILDSAGNMLSQHQSSEFSSATGENQNYKTQSEERLRGEIEKMLERTVGKDKVIASVQMDLDFSSQKSVETIYNPKEQEAIVQTEKSLVEQQTAAASGAPAGGQAASTKAGQPSSVRNDSTKNYAVSQMVQETALTVPTLKRLTVGVMVDGVYDETKGADGKVVREYRVRPPEQMAELEKVVKAIIGFNTDTRQDVVEVSCVPFQIESQDLGAKPMLSPELRHLVEQGIQWGVVGLIGLLLILMVLKPAIRQITVAPVKGNYNALPGGAGMPDLSSLAGMDPNDPAALAAAHMIDPTGKLTQQQLAGRLLALQENNKVASEGSQIMFKEMQNEVRTNPERSVSLIRQWMEEG